MRALLPGEGFLLLSTGEERKQWIFNLIYSIKQAYENPAIHVLTDVPLDVDYTLINSLSGYDSRFYKTQLYSYSPFETTIFLDDDTLVIDAFGDLDALLGTQDIGMALDPFASLGLWRDNILRSCVGQNNAWDAFSGYIHDGLKDNPYFNSGVMIWRRTESIERLFESWHRLWKEGGGGPDQTWLAIAILEQEVVVKYLPQIYNFYPVVEHCVGHSDYPSLGDAKIIHFLSPYGKKMMDKMVKFHAPAHSAYIASVVAGSLDASLSLGKKGRVTTADLVVSRFNEDLSWLSEVPDDVRVIVYNKGEKICVEEWLERIDILEDRPNVGREAETYLYHIRSKRSLGSEWIIFSQADPFPHSPDFIDLIGKRDDWRGIQAMSWRWLEEHNIPPGLVIDLERKDWVAGLRVRLETFSLRTWSPISFHDPGTVLISRDYREHYSLPEGSNIAEHFLRLAMWDKLADDAAAADCGVFSYGAIFAVRAERLHDIPELVINRMIFLSLSHHVIAYIFERMWLHIFGMGFTCIGDAIETTNVSRNPSDHDSESVFDGGSRLYSIR